ncbi:MAG: NifU C-terminal protein VnfU [Pseudomonadota bacterium]|jgi:NifU-like protein
MSNEPDELATDAEELNTAPIVMTPELVAIIEATIEQARPAVQNDGGDLELVAIEDGIVRVALKGACTHCHMAGQTLGGIRRLLTRATGLPLRVLPATG